jgi:hypothetical protein
VATGPDRPGSATESGSQPRRSFLCPPPESRHRLFVNPIDRRRQRLKRGKALGPSRPRSCTSRLALVLVCTSTVRGRTEGRKFEAPLRYSAHATHSSPQAGRSCSASRSSVHRVGNGNAGHEGAATYHGAGCIARRRLCCAARSCSAHRPVARNLARYHADRQVRRRRRQRGRQGARPPSGRPRVCPAAHRAVVRARQTSLLHAHVPERVRAGGTSARARRRAAAQSADALGRRGRWSMRDSCPPRSAGPSTP